MAEPDEAHFRSIPWCSQLIDDPAFTITPTFSRQFKSSTEDSLFAETLQTNNTINACLSVYRRPSPPETFIPEVRTLLTLGSGLNGGAHVLHGGITAAIIDDVIGTLLTVNKDGKSLPLTWNTLTASLNVRYLRRVETPGTVVVVARCREVKGRKYFMEAEVRDGEGQKLAEAESLWIGINKSKEKL